MATEHVGERLRDARMLRGLSLRGLATSLGVSPSLISQVENGKVLPSVSTLYAIVTELGVSLDEILDHTPRSTAVAPAAVASAPGSVVQRAAENPVLEMSNGVRWERLATGDGPADALLVVYAPGARSSLDAAPTRHAGVEYALVLDGEITLRLDDETHVLGPGDSLHFDSSRPHLYSNDGSVPARGVWFVVGRRALGDASPAGPPAVLASAVEVMDAMDAMR